VHHFGRRRKFWASESVVKLLVMLLSERRWKQWSRDWGARRKLFIGI